MDQKTLLTDVLKNVSRAFYTSLWILPGKLKLPISLGYLFCRAADTMADTKILDRSRRLDRLEQFRRQFSSREFDYALIHRLSQDLSPYQTQDSERVLVARLPDCFQLLESLPLPEQALVREAVLGVTQGMEMDLQYFANDNTQNITSLKTREELDRYCFFVAGNPGSFWTRLCFLKYPSFQPLDILKMNDHGIRLGKTLQMTNILRDLAQDLRIGRCYIPEEDLKIQGLTAKDLLDKSLLPRFRPILHSLILLTLDHADAGLDYVLAIPRRHWRLRLACLWPLLMALKTLALVAQSEELLDPDKRVKITRGQVTRILWSSGLLGWSNGEIKRMFERLKKDCVRACGSNNGGLQ